MYEFEKIIFEVTDHVAVINLNRPEKLNMLYVPYFRDLIKTADIIDNDQSIFVAIITGGEKVFSAGDDVNEPEEMLRQKELGLFEWMRVLQTTLNRIARIKKPVIAAVAGYALGGGLELALACDFIVASENARLGLTEAKLGLLPCGGGTQRLPRLVGKPRAKEMMFCGDMLTAEESYEIGLVNHVYPEGTLMENAIALAQKICKKTSPVSNRMIKDAVNRGAEVDLDTAIYIECANAAAVGESEDKIEGMKAFAEKRAPIWPGK